MQDFGLIIGFTEQSCSFLLDLLSNVFTSGQLNTAQYVFKGQELSPNVFILLPALHPPPVRIPEGRRLQRRTKKFSTFQSITNKWEIFQNFFGNSGKNMRQRSCLGKLAINIIIYQYPVTSTSQLVIGWFRVT